MDELVKSWQRAENQRRSLFKMTRKKRKKKKVDKRKQAEIKKLMRKG